MPSLRQTKRRIKTAKNISQVTKAMEMVSAVKMRRVQAAAVSGRPYIFELEKMIRVLAGQQNLEERPAFLLLPKIISKVTVLVIGPQKGLCGALITNLGRALVKFLDAAKKGEDLSKFIFFEELVNFSTKENKNPVISFVTFERKAEGMVRRLNSPILASFNLANKSPRLFDVRPMADFLLSLFDQGETDLILVAYSHFVSTVTQKAVIRPFLPIFPETLGEANVSGQFLFEPSAKEVLDGLLLRFAEAVLYQIVMESLAAEHSARMMAMKNAHENADQIIADLTLFYNKARQEAITTELLTISSGYEESR